MTTTNRDKPYLPSDIDMTSPNDNNKELQNSDNVLSIPSVSPSANSANTDKQKMKATGMGTRGRDTPVGQGAYTQRKLKIRGGSIQSKNFYTEHPPTTASTPSIITPHSPRTGPSNDSKYDSTFIPTQHSISSSEESSEESVISSDSSSN